MAKPKRTHFGRYVGELVSFTTSEGVYLTCVVSELSKVSNCRVFIQPIDPWNKQVGYSFAADAEECLPISVKEHKNLSPGKHTSRSGNVRILLRVETDPEAGTNKVFYYLPGGSPLKPVVTARKSWLCWIKR